MNEVSPMTLRRGKGARQTEKAVARLGGRGEISKSVLSGRGHRGGHKLIMRGGTFDADGPTMDRCEGWLRPGPPYLVERRCLSS
jgi:hypothetical protein